MKKLNIIPDKLFTECISQFGNNLQCILHLGSSLRGNTLSSDIDIIVILKRRETLTDLKILREIIKNYKFSLDIQLINMFDMKGWNFSHFTHGQFFIYFLRSAKVIFGVNPFNKLFLDDNYLISSVYQKTQYYYCRAKTLLLDGRYIDTILNKKEFYYHKKKIIFMLIDYWCATTKVSSDLKSCDYKKILNNLELDQFYFKNLSFFEKEYTEYNFQHIFELYHIIYFSITDALNKEIIKRKII